MKKEILKNTVSTVQAKKQVLRGKVTSDKMDKTIVVEVSRYIKHPKYQKYYTVHKKYKAHCEDDSIAVGDMVDIISSKPISKDKSFVLLSKVK
jgi:small subunit ribosomal protein S17